MLDGVVVEAGLRLLAAIGQGVVDGAGYLLGGNNTEAAVTQKLPALNPRQTAELQELNKRLLGKTEEERKELLKRHLDIQAIQKLKDARETEAREAAAAKNTAAQAKQEQKELFNTSLPRDELSRTITNGLDFNDSKFKGPYFDGLRQFQNLPPCKAQRQLISNHDITPEAFILQTMQNYKDLKDSLINIQQEPSNPFLDFCYFMGDIPKPLSLFDISKGFLDDPLFKDLEKIFASVESKLLSGPREMTNKTSMTQSTLPADGNPFAIRTTETTPQTESETKSPAPKGPGPR